MQQDSSSLFDVLTALLLAILAGSVLVAGIRFVANEMDWNVNAILITGIVLICLGFVALCAVVWQSIRRLMD